MFKEHLRNMGSHKEDFIVFYGYIKKALGIGISEIEVYRLRYIRLYAVYWLHLLV